jgi:hypothetical protein
MGSHPSCIELEYPWVKIPKFWSVTFFRYGERPSVFLGYIPHLIFHIHTNYPSNKKKISGRILNLFYLQKEGSG